MSNNEANLVEDWRKYFEDSSVPEELSIKYINYIENLLEKGFPIVFELKHLSKLIGVKYLELVKIVNSPDKYYRKFYIEKRSGGVREISSPYPILSICQRWIYNNILEKASVSEFSFAYVKGRTIVENADKHLGNDELLKVDVKDFFGSIKIISVKEIFKSFGYTDSLSYFFACICCLNDSLPQGACTSPSISNIFSKRIDLRISSLCQKLDLSYSRYADDISISGAKVNYSLVSIIEKILLDDGLFLNDKKTVLKRKGQKKVVTGVCITGNIKRATKNYRREFRKDYHYFKLNGMLRKDRDSSFDIFYVNRLIGRAMFILSLEPDNDYVKAALSDLQSTI